MRIAVEISLYPLNADYIPPIKAFIDRLNTYAGISVQTNAMSTQIAGEHAEVFKILATETERTFAEQGRRVFVMKFLGGQGLSDILRSALQELLGTSLWEAAAVLLALAYLLLAVRRSLWCWPSAFISTAIYLVLMARAHLYMQTLLQVFYLVMAIYGFLQWRQNRDAAGEVPVLRWSWAAHAAAATLVVAASALNGWMLSSHSDAHAPYLDSFVTWGSVITTWMVARRLIENWLYWIIVDAVAAYLYFDQGLHATALLFIAYIGIVIHGYFTWRRTETTLDRDVNMNADAAEAKSEPR